MTETGIGQEAVYSLEKRFDQKVAAAQNVNVFTGETQDWKSLFKHPPSNLKFRRNSGGNRDSKRVIKIPCTSNTAGYIEPRQDYTKVPAPRAASSSPTKVYTRRKDSYPEAPLETVKLHDHSGSAGNSSMSSSPTSQVSSCPTANEEPEENVQVYTEEETAECYGCCSLCGLPIDNEESGCVVIDKLYHNKCFTCQKCDHNLTGENFYLVQDKILCKTDYLLALDKCYLCNQPISDQVIRADNRPYHLSCFKCTDCGVCLDGVPFVSDFSDKIYCVEDYHRAFAPRCQICEEPILPNKTQPNSKRLIAMNMNFHVGCYCCVECGISLVTDDRSEPQCFPIEQHPLCLDCNKLWSLQRHSAQTSPDNIKLTEQTEHST